MDMSGRDVAHVHDSGYGDSAGADPRACRAAFCALLDRVHAALAPRGVLVFDVVTPERQARRSAPPASRPAG
jgi:hypothetical protein